MARYYCDYCKSYLTHDTLSVRKSHLIGKIHLRKVAEYYEEEARKLGILEEEAVDTPYHVSIKTLYKGAPGFAKVVNRHLDDSILLPQRAGHKRQHVVHGQMEDTPFNSEAAYRLKTIIPPPPTLNGLPNPPPPVVRTKESYEALMDSALQV